MLNMVKRLWVEEEGQGMAEYALILAFVAIIVIFALQRLQGGISGKLDEITEVLEEEAAESTG